MPTPLSHSFRYEPELGTLGDGQTLAEWRRSGSEVAPGPAGARPGRRRAARLARRRAVVHAAR